MILNNGSDGPISAMWTGGGAAAVARGYNAIAFDGPGQGASLFLQHLYFRPDWEHVVTPVVDYLLTRPDVDPKRLAITGTSQGGYWVPRAVAFEHRIAAAVADPGVFDVSTSFLGNLPSNMRRLLERGEQEKFDRDMDFAEQVSKQTRSMMAFRGRPYGMTSPYQVFKAAQDYTLKDVVGHITCPMLVLDPEGEQFWPASHSAYDAELPEDDHQLHRSRRRRSPLRAEVAARARSARLRLARNHLRHHQVADSSVARQPPILEL